jgi:glycosyltransferase involved in cell wall biosynthesis
MKIGILVDAEDAFTEKYLSSLLNQLDSHTVTLYYILPPKNKRNGLRILNDSQYLYKNANSRMYQSFFEEIQNQGFDRVIATRLHFSEYFFLEVISRQLDKVPFSIAFYGWNEVTNFTSREFLIEKFLMTNGNNRILLHSNAWWDNSPLLASVIKDRVDRIIPLSDPIYDEAEEFQTANQHDIRAELGIPSDEKIVLFFGSMFFGKGPDILLSSLQALPENYSLILAGDISSVNFDFPREIYSSPRVIKFEEFIPEDLVPKLFLACDLVCLPYRISYKHGTSGVLVQAALANKPVVAPNMPPFSEVVSRYTVGATFETENSDSLATTIVQLASSNLNVNWSDYLNAMSSWREIADAYLAH